MGKDRIVITTSSFGKADKEPLELAEKYFDIVLNPYGRKLTTDEFIELTEGAVGVIAGVESITREALEQRKGLKVISRCGVGMDSVDQQACIDFGIRLCNTPEAPVDSVAELTVSLILTLLKGIIPMNEEMHQRNWSKQVNYLAKNKNVGIIGFGRIGKKVASLLRAFDVNIAYSDLCDQKCDYAFMEKESLLKWSDIVTLHCSGGSGGNYLLGKAEIEQMKEHSYIINTSRGSFIDESALQIALQSGKIAGAALDVYETEPYAGALCEQNNVILTPHIASSAKEGRKVMEMEALKNLMDALEIG